MDSRKSLRDGTILSFPGMACRIDQSIGRGSNALVYQGSYEDAVTVSRRHRVLVKELFPWDPQGHIWRDDTGAVCRDEQGERIWETHRISFERGNEVHLDLLARRPDQISGNMNTFPLNGTLYTLLDDMDSRSLEDQLRENRPEDLRSISTCMTGLLDALEVFHQRGYLHLDISPDNVLLVGSGDQERVTLIDYNSVHTWEEISQGAAVYFSEKEGYSAPEIATGMHGEIRASTDLYSVAAIFYRILMGRALTFQEMNRRYPPDGQESPLLQGSPETVMAQVRKILRKGLNILPEKRYQSCDQMRQDFEELRNRIEGRGVTHAALWEAGRHAIQKLVRNNPSLAYLGKEGALYPVRIRWRETGEEFDIGHLTELEAQERGAPILLSGAGGLGKTTTLYRSVLFSGGAFTPAAPARMCISLSAWKREDSHFLLDAILRDLRFSQDTHTLEDARHQLLELLSHPILSRGRKLPVLILLLDGLNEVAEDPAELLEEIGRLSVLPGLRIVMASRNVPEGFPSQVAEVLPLAEEEVGEVLGRHGLLIPDAEEMRALLRTPLMLSLFIQTAEAQSAQVYCGSQRELIQGYLEAICEKTAREEQETRYQSDAAIRLILPAIAEEINRRGRPLGDAELLDTVMRCRRQLRGRVLARAFPEWIGHGEEITKARELSGESWYGLIVQQLLWRRLGLLVRDEFGKYHVMHDIIQQELVQMNTENQAAIRRARFRRGVAAWSVLLCLALCDLGVYEIWLKPTPYSERMSEIVLQASNDAFQMYGVQYDVMDQLLEGAVSAEEAMKKMAELEEKASLIPSRTSQVALKAMEESDGEVIPWSGKTLNFEPVSALMQLPSETAREYLRLIQVYDLTSAADAASRGIFKLTLRELLNEDADWAYLLDQQGNQPHRDMSHGGMSTYSRELLPSELQSRYVSRTLEEIESDRVETLLTLSQWAAPVRRNETGGSTESSPETQQFMLTGPITAEEGMAILLEYLSGWLDKEETAMRRSQELIDSAQAFLDQFSYPLLLQTRINASRLAQRENSDGIIGLTASDEVILSMLNLGARVEYLEALVRGERAYGKDAVINGAAAVWTLLRDGTFDQEKMETIWREASDLQKRQTRMASYDCLCVNYILSGMNSYAEVRAFWENLPNRWPLLGAGQEPWEKDETSLIEKVKAIGQNDNQGEDEAACSPHLLKRDSYLVSGLPRIIPCALLTGEYEIAMNSGRGDFRQDQIPEQVILTINGVSNSAYIDYVNSLSNRKDISIQAGQGGEHIVSLSKDAESMMLRWTEDPLCMTICYDPHEVTLETQATLTYYQGTGILDSPYMEEFYEKYPELLQGFRMTSAAEKIKDQVFSAELITKMCAHGSASAMVILGKLFAEGAEVPQSDETARSFFVLASQNGSSEAKVELGKMYYEGKGVDQDYEAAFQWYRQAAEAGSPEGMLLYADMLRKGEGGSQNINLAMKMAEDVLRMRGVNNALIAFANQIIAGVEPDKAVPLEQLKSEGENTDQSAVTSDEMIRDMEIELREVEKNITTEIDVSQIRLD